MSTEHSKAPYSSIATPEEILSGFCNELPNLPSVLRYYDEFEGKVRSINSPATSARFDLFLSGQRISLDLSCTGAKCSIIFKHVFAFLLAQDLSIRTVSTYLQAARHLRPHDVAMLIDAGPSRIGSVWKVLRARGLPSAAYMSAKALLHLSCAYRLNGWSNEYRDYLKTTLPLPLADKYAGVRSGDVFLAAEEEALIIRHLDKIASDLTQSFHVRPTDKDIADAGMLLCAYQFAMRPIQIAMLDGRHVRIWDDRVTGTYAVHLTFYMAKQRSGKRIKMTRRVKTEWTPLFIHWQRYRTAEKIAASEKFFLAESNNEVGSRIASLVHTLIDSEDIGTATDLRHTAAQRLVDAGASHEELAEFLGHAQTNTGLVYYTTSASHAERINRALGASSVYRRVAKIAHDGFIAPAELAKLKDVQQIAAVPHGIPISGIGGCQSGQPSCPFNPITSCYGCRKFMPVYDKNLHEKVLSDIRSVVLFFNDSSRNDVRSPAYLQLQRTITEIQAVIAEFSEESK